MRAAVTRTGHIEVTEVADPVPGSGHVLVRPLAAGICGSDLHAAQDLRRFADLSTRVGLPGGLDPDQGVVFGHEFCAEVVEHGPDTAGTLAVGTRVCCVPTIFGPTGPEAVGYSNRFPGALAERMVLQEALLLPVPDGLATDLAALTEPLAVGEHAVGLARLTGDEACLVVGCGPVGLAVVAALKARGQGPVVAADFSPTRRRLAEALGADVVLDPAETSPYGRWEDLGVPANPLDRAAREMFGVPFTEAVIFEAVGVPGMLQAIIDGAPPKARVVVVGVCMETDHIQPFFGVVKELELRFAFGYTAAEFAATLDRLAEGSLAAVGELVTDVVDLDGAPGAFAALAHPGEHGKVLVHPAAMSTSA
jgi:threonine dehydrogenase-like Zn-dependent dehydrogenase